MDASVGPKSARSLAAAAAAVLAFALAAPAAHAQADDPHAQALLALSGLEAAIAQIDASSRVTGAAPDPYRQTAQRAANALVGIGAPDHVTDAGNLRDTAGALTHLSWLTAHGGASVWAPTVQGALVNVKVAATQLDAAAKADELEEFWQHTSAALQALLVAAGDESRLGVLGGLRGAIATTDLGVPPHARIVSGCAPPPEAPAYGVAKGHLIYVAVRSDGGSTRWPEALGIRDVSAQGGIVVMRTVAADLVGTICSRAQAAAPVLVANHTDDAAPAGLYTKQQAKDGQQVYAQHCASCHGNMLQGTSAPAAGGTAFLNKAKLLGWSVADMRNLVLTSMPRDNPGSLSPTQYADVLAYLLASDCYPAGQKQFPTTATPDIKGAELHPLADASGQDKTSGTCSLGP